MMEQELTKVFEIFECSKWEPQFQTRLLPPIVWQKSKRNNKTGVNTKHTNMKTRYAIRRAIKPIGFKCNVKNEREGSKITTVLKMFGVYVPLTTIPNVSIEITLSDACKFMSLVKKNQKIRQ